LRFDRVKRKKSNRLDRQEAAGLLQLSGSGPYLRLGLEGKKQKVGSAKTSPTEAFAKPTLVFISAGRLALNQKQKNEGSLER
jgi:hypothetical protein